MGDFGAILIRPDGLLPAAYLALVHAAPDSDSGLSA